MKKVLVISHERSGTHMLINSIGMNFNYNPQWIDVHCKDYIDPEPAYIRGYKSDIEKFFVRYAQVETNRIFKSHHQFGYYADCFESILENFHIFYIARDVRGVLASCYRYFNEAQVPAFPHCDTFKEFAFDTIPWLYPYDGAYSYIKADNMIDRWKKHIDSWMPVFDKITVLSYADMQNNFSDNIAKISNTLGVACPNGIKQPAVATNSINPGNGVVEGWKSIITEEESAKIMTLATCKTF